MTRTPDIEFLAVDRWLDQWGQWARGTLQRGLPSRSVIGRMMEEGAQAACQGSSKTTCSDIVAQVEKAVSRAPERQREILIVHYCTHRHLPIQSQAGRLSVSRTRVYEDLRVAQAFVAGALLAD